MIWGKQKQKIWLFLRRMECVKTHATDIANTHRNEYASMRVNNIQLNGTVAVSFARKIPSSEIKPCPMCNDSNIKTIIYYCYLIWSLVRRLFFFSPSLPFSSIFSRIHVVYYIYLNLFLQSSQWNRIPKVAHIIFQTSSIFLMKLHLG